MIGEFMSIFRELKERQVELPLDLACKLAGLANRYKDTLAVRTWDHDRVYQVIRDNNLSITYGRLMGNLDWIGEEIEDRLSTDQEVDWIIKECLDKLMEGDND